MMDKSKTSICMTALDGIVKVSYPFVVAIFIGFCVTASSTGQQPSCDHKAPGLSLHEIVSFSWFLFTAFIAQSLKLVINLLNNLDPSDDDHDHHKADHDINPMVLKAGLLVSAFACFMGCAFLMLFIAELVEMKVGVNSCGDMVWFAVPLVVGVGSSLVFFFASLYALRFI